MKVSPDTASMLASGGSSIVYCRQHQSFCRDVMNVLLVQLPRLVGRLRLVPDDWFRRAWRSTETKQKTTPTTRNERASCFSVNQNQCDLGALVVLFGLTVVVVPLDMKNCRVAIGR